MNEKEKELYLKELRKLINSHVRMAFIKYMHHWKTNDAKSIRTEWERFKKFLDEQIGK